jgi:hypothetical protein
VPRSDDNVVLKYCELLDEFIRIRTTTDDGTRQLIGNGQVTSRAAYHQLVVNLCVVDYEGQVLPLFQRHNKVYQTEALVELLYQICIEVNPQLEIHSVTLPTDSVEEGGLDLGDLGAEEAWLEEEELTAFQERVRDIEDDLGKRVVGQSVAVHSVSHAVKKAAVGLKDPRKPVGVFLLVGPTGTGKTELAKSLTRQLFGNLSSLVRIDCSEYALPHEYAKLIGAPPGYIGHNEGGQLTEAVKKAKTCVVLFDEIEKAHEKVHNLLLQLMDEGTLTDSKGEKISFQRCVVLMTSNIGMDDIRRIADRVGFGARKPDSVDADSVAFTMVEAVKKAFRPEFINRIDEVIQFRPLSVADCEEIAKLQLNEMAGYLERTGVHLRFAPSLFRHLARMGWSAEYGARELRRHIRDLVEDPLTQKLMDGEFCAGDKVSICVRGKSKVVMTNVRRGKSAKSSAKSSAKPSAKASDKASDKVPENQAL